MSFYHPDGNTTTQHVSVDILSSPTT